ncbi:MAG: glycosyltransferase, partial [Lachnospiraceae bacterium]|nr:glycosyltransferase [Lachnospiraceae bacterium]
MKKVLVLMSTYNGSSFIEKQICSILDQKTDHEIYLHIRDDGSTDDTCRIIKRLSSQYPERISLKEAKNIGSNGSFFELIKAAEGFDFYSISDQDDIWMQNKVQVACDHLSAENSSIPLLFASTSLMVDHDCVPFGETRKQEREFTIYNTMIQNICPGHNQIFNNSLLELLKKVSEYQNIYVYDMWITNIAMLYGKILFYNAPLTYYRQHSENQMGSRGSKIGKLMTSFQRMLAGDGEKTKTHMRYFIELNKKQMTEAGCLDEIEEFLNAINF